MNALAVAEIEHLRLLFVTLSVPRGGGGTFSVREARDACAELPSRLGLLCVWGLCTGSQGCWASRQVSGFIAALHTPVLTSSQRLIIFKG